MKKKIYKNLSQKEELELFLWLIYLKESLDNTQTQMIRWNRFKNPWDLEMFFGGVVYIDNAIVGLKRFLNHGKDYINESRFWDILKQFRKNIKKYKIGDLRNNLVHREKIFKLQDEKGNILPLNSILILGGYNFTTDEYQFGPYYKIRVLEIFTEIEKLRKDIKKLYAEKLKRFYTDKNNKYENMIPFAFLHDFEVKPKNRFKSTKKYLKKMNSFKEITC